MKLSCLLTTTIIQPFRLTFNLVEVVVDLLKEWKNERPEDNIHLRLKGDHLEPDNDNSDLELNHGDEQETEDDVRIGEAYTRKLYGTNSKFLYVHQTQWQRRLLELYGKEICLLDATYRTTRYSLPLYFLCVPTNVNYITVGTFVTETEDSASLMEGLQVIKEWNPEWSPKFFMCDYATEEINALENVFPGSFVYLCDFHREQSWERWLTAAHNGLHTEKTNVLSLLRPIARALNEDDYNSALSTLKSSSVWNEKEKLRKWFEKTWLSCPRRWVRAHRQERFNVSVNTNNGIERQNLSLKYEYLDKKKARSLSQLLSVLIRKFLPDSYGWKELNALVLSTFGTWKQKFKLRVGCEHGYFLTVKDIENGKLLERIESLMSQNLNEGYNYFMDVVFVEAQILIVSHLRGITITEADKVLYPVKKHNEQV
ncbi:unnamed protein product [Mytilus coruscus]|uniref:ZSWIM1/3 RNaseH-like domain-containing protein n=1 Tax=Mytilus coruscus TaxID=42192 RepID=A0A6J8DT87_MYTCO|nr:unnamed protein product [Mytilus coruscus]